jgi:hypothetical protein
MSLAGRIQVAVAVTIMDAAAAVIYYRAGLPLIDMAQTDFQGPFTPIASNLETVVPVVLSVLLLAIWLWVIYGAVQSEKNRVVAR